MIKESIKETTMTMEPTDKLVNLAGHMVRETEAFRKQYKELNKILNFVTLATSQGKSSMDDIELACDGLMILRGLAERIEELMDLARDYSIEIAKDKE